ncbi:hypothetical protein Tco_0046264 [Tanacetum coccineum]
MSLESLEVMLKTHEKNEYAWGDKYEQMEYDLKIRDLKLEEKQKELDQALKERDDFKVKLEKWSNASVLQNEVLNKQRYVSDKSCIGFGIESSNSMESNISSGDETLNDSAYENFKREKAYKAVPPPTGTIIPPRANVSFTGIDELAIRNKVVNQEKTKSSQPEIDRNKVIIEDWVDSDDEETDVSESQKETAFNSENSETSFENRSPNSQNSFGQESRTKGLGNKGGKLCFVCYSPNHLIKDCNLHERTFKQTQTHKPKGIQGSRETRPVWNNIQRVNHSNFSRNSRYPHQRRSFIPSAVLTRDGLISTARPKMTQTVPSKSTANVTYQGTARSRVPQAVLSRSTDGSSYPRMDNRRPRISSFSPSSRSSTTRTPHRPQRPKKIVKSIWVKKGSTVGSQAVLPQTVKKSAMINPKQTWRPKGNYLDSVNRGNGSYTLKQFEYGNPEEDLKVHTDDNVADLLTKGFDLARFNFLVFSCRITPLTPSMLEVVTALAAEEEHSTSPHSRAASSARDAQGTPTQSAAHSQRTASVQGTASFHGTATPHNFDAVPGTDTLQGIASVQAKVLEYIQGHKKGSDCLHVNFLKKSGESKGKSSALHPGGTYCSWQKKFSVLYRSKLYMRACSFEHQESLAQNSDDDTPKDGIFSTNSFDAEEGGVADYNNLDPTIDVPSTPTLRIHKIHPQKGKWVLCWDGNLWVLETRDERRWGILSSNKARIVAPGYRQEEGDGVRVHFNMATSQKKCMSTDSGFEVPGSSKQSLQSCQAPLWPCHSSPKSHGYERLSTFLLKHWI